MPIRPVQLLIVLGLDRCAFDDELIAELERLHDADVLRVIDAIALRKDADGAVKVRQLIEPGGHDAIGVPRTRHVGEQLPDESEAALVLIEHHWTSRLHDVIASVGGFQISDGFIISPLDAARIGVLS